MSVQASAWASLVTVGDPHAKLVLLILSDWSVAGQIYPSHLNRLTGPAEMTDAMVRDALLILKERGFLTELKFGSDGLAFAYALPDGETMSAAIKASYANR